MGEKRSPDPVGPSQPESPKRMKLDLEVEGGQAYLLGWLILIKYVKVVHLYHYPTRLLPQDPAMQRINHRMAENNRKTAKTRNGIPDDANAMEILETREEAGSGGPKSRVPIRRKSLVCPSGIVH